MEKYHKIHGIYKRYKEGEKKGRFIMGEYSRPEFEMLKDIQWTWTEKVDGTNIRLQWLTDPLISEVWIKGKEEKSEIPKHLLEQLKQLCPKEKMLEIFGEGEEVLDVCLYGEGYGYKIQGGGKYFKRDKETGFILFDVKIGNCFLKRADVGDIAVKLDIPFVPLVGKGTIEEAIRYVKTNPKTWVGENNNFIMEGLVIRPETELRDRMGRRIITKIKVCDFKED